MTNKDLVKYYQQQVDSDLIVFKFIKDDDVRQDDLFIQGWFNPDYFECGEETPIEIEIIAYDEADISDEDVPAIDREVVRTVNHEMVHYNQWKEGRYDFDEVENNEPEAYANENTGQWFNL